MRSRLHREEAGFTLVELLVGMTIGIVVLFATLRSADLFAGQTDADAAVLAAQDTARTTVRDLVTFARQGRVATGEGSPLPGALAVSRSDLVLAAWVASATEPRPGDTPGWVRWCSQTSGGRTSLLVGVRTGDAFQAPGPCAPGTQNGWTTTVAVDGLLRMPDRLFDFTSSTCQGASCLPAPAAVRAVGIRIAVGTDDASASVVRDAVSFRNQG